MSTAGRDPKWVKHKGPVMMRRGQVDHGTTDQRLLDSRGPTDWVHTDPWRVVTEKTVRWHQSRRLDARVCGPMR